MAGRDIPKAYEPGSIEPRWAEVWVREQLFTPEVAARLRPPDKGAFSLAIPPPNVTAPLHMVGRRPQPGKREAPPPRARPRRVRAARLAVEGRQRRHHQAADGAAGGFLRLDARARHARPAALPRRHGGLPAALPRRAHLPRALHD